MNSRVEKAWQPLFGYSTNVHKGDTLEQIYRNLERYTIPVKRRIFGSAPGGLELHLNMKTAAALRERGEREAFKDFLEKNGLVLFSVNAYPLKPFHSRRVKEQVYSPSWTEALRSRWTNIIAEILAALIPSGVPGSVSTLGGAYRRQEHGPPTFRKLARNYLRTVDALEKVERTTGKHIVLAVEPEPETTFENAADVIRFYEDHLFPAAQALWSKSGAAVEETLRRYFTVNFDTCHFSVLFEDLVLNLRRLRRAGLAVGKIHVTNAIRLPSPLRSTAGFQDFRGMHEPRYFHQFCAIDKSGKVVWRDLDLNRLPRKLEASQHAKLQELRCHYHVPLYLKRFRRLHTTQDETRRAIEEVKRRRTTTHLVIETYTWPLLEREEKLVSGIAKEFRWLLKALDLPGCLRRP